MKTFIKFCLTLTYLLSSMVVFSQNFISENKVWSIVSKGGMFEQWTKTTSLKFSGDTTVQETIYKKLYSSGDEQKVEWTLHSLWFERNDSVFRHGAWYEGDVLVYDFSIAEKDSFTVIKDELYLYVDSIRTKEWGNKERELIYFHPSEVI